MKSSKPRIKTVIERFLLSQPQWQSGYQSFAKQLGVSVGWVYLVKNDKSKLCRLDRKGNVTSHHSTSAMHKKVEEFLAKFAEDAIKKERETSGFPRVLELTSRDEVIVYALQHFGRFKGLLFFLPKSKVTKETQSIVQLFDYFLTSHVELAYKNFELNNFYETVHPRALALSTMHSVHRVISSSLRLHELLPRIGRLSAQVLKAKGCSIMLVCPDREYLTPYFACGENAKLVHSNRVRIGRGLQGKIAETGDFHLNRRSIAVPFIEDDIVGVIALWDKLDGQVFTKIDLEILKSLSEQAVVAIKNAQLYEETEQLTLGSIKAINELLELNFGGDRSQLPVFREIVLELAKELGLSSREQMHLERAIFLLDTGAMALPDKVLHKKGKLTKKEFAQIKRIPSKGANLLHSISSLRPITPIILHQHERFDGKGYPQGLVGEQIPIGARIVSVVNSLLAMISRRSYRDAMTVDRAMHEIQSNEGTQFDPQVVKCFIKVVKRKPMQEKLKKIQKSALKVIEAA